MPKSHHDFITPLPTKGDEILLQRFLNENKIPDFSYRCGGVFTAQFGIEEGWGPNWAEGYVRIHTGVDRARGGTLRSVKDVVVSPFNFDSSEYIDYNGSGYGSLVVLKSKTFQFELKIAHMNPKTDIIPWALKQILEKKPIQQGWIIGSAGTYGYSTGAHTHSELVSTDESCEIFELLLLQKFGTKVFREYTDEEIINYYRNQSKRYPKTSPYTQWDDGKILADWLNQKRKKQIFFINPYKICFFQNGKSYTRYATNKVLEDF
jgi:murein DD-endopeptidase MepM/ murein hydrolase activator NlpD